MTISDFLYKLPGGGSYIDSKVSPEFLSKLINDFGVPQNTVEIVGVLKKEYNLFSETSILYKFPKDSKGIGDYFKYLGNMINRIPLVSGMDIGIQELDPSRPDGYYILLYILEEVRE